MMFRGACRQEVASRRARAHAERVARGAECYGRELATGTAVLAGSYLSQYLSERAILTIGGVLFLLFAFTTAFGIF